MAVGSLQIWTIDGAGTISYQLIAADAAEVWIKTRPIDLQDPRTKKHLRRLIHDIEGASQATSLRAKLYTKDAIDGDETLVSNQLVSSGNPLKFRLPNCRYIVIEFYDDKVDYIWKLSGFELWGTLTSKRF
jgi:hypothetical protein